MPLHVSTRADDADKHASDVNALVYAKGRLYSGADDGKIKVDALELKFLRTLLILFLLKDMGGRFEICG